MWKRCSLFQFNHGKKTRDYPPVDQSEGQGLPPLLGFPEQYIHIYIYIYIYIFTHSHRPIFENKNYKISITLSTTITTTIATSAYKYKSNYDNITGWWFQPL
jgi:hypothetical protein